MKEFALPKTSKVCLKKNSEITTLQRLTVLAHLRFHILYKLITDIENK